MWLSLHPSINSFTTNNICLSKLNFNDKILSNITNNNILEEVMYSVGLSLCDEDDVKEVIFMVNNIIKGTFVEE